MVRQTVAALFFLVALLMFFACTAENETPHTTPPTSAPDYGLVSSAEVLVTSEQGDKIAPRRNITFAVGQASGPSIIVRPDIVKQTITGIGSSFTESSAFVLAHLDESQRRDVMNNIWGDDGANFSLARTVIGSTDFAVNGKYSYAPEAGDAKLENFRIDVDKDGFRQARYPGISDESYDLLPMIKEALAIKQAQQEKELRIIASAWTAPPWMKDIDTWFIRGSPENNWQGSGGQLKPQYVATYADYLIRYLDAYRAEGVSLWGLTPVNEPNGNGGHWESMHFTPQTQNDFIKNHLGPRLQASDHRDIKLLIYDQNRDHLQVWADAILGDPETAPYVYGTAVHWYSSTYKVYEDVLDAVHNKYPDFDIIHTEGTIDDLGKPAPGGVSDPERFEESDWFDNDSFWWNENATDWAYTASWAPNAEDHPIYTPVHRYARNIIVSLNHWMSGWIDWNIVLDSNGGPNHAGNFCGAPIMIDVESGQVYYTPIYHVLAQFSRTIRPGDKAVQTSTQLDGLDDDALHASATINTDGLLSVQMLNTTKQPLQVDLQIGAQVAPVTIPANAVQTVRVQIKPGSGHAGDSMKADFPGDGTRYFGQQSPGLKPTAFAPGIVSTDDLELGGAFLPDMSEFYFDRQKQGEPIKSYVMRFENGAWQEPSIVDDSEGLFISPDGNTMHLGNEYRERTATGWSVSRPLGPMFDNFPIMRLTVSDAGTYVFDEREEIGTIRYSRLTDGNREEPKAFGKEINSGKWTAHPFIAPDESYLIWDSERDGGYGATDLYISFRQPDGTWGAAINMGGTINTEYEDGGGSVTPDGKYFFFNTINLGESFSESDANIYWVDAQIIESLRDRQ